MFVNREDVLSLLEREYANASFRFSIIYGRRRVGKTTLIKQYISPKPYIYFLATLESMPILLKRFQEIIADKLNDELLLHLKFENFKQLFTYITKQNFQKKLIIVIDEFQYLGKIERSIPSQFQYIVDEILATKNIHLILCGSIISMMYEQTLSYNSPLYGRRTSSIKLDSLKFNYIDNFFPQTSTIEQIELYSILYGVPKYLEFFSYTGDIFKSIEKYILDKNSFLYDEPRFILQNEVNEPITYFSILETIAKGDHKIGNIAGKLDKNVQNITSFMSKLIELEIIYKEIPITETNPQKSKKGLYFIKDNFFRFWFNYVLPYKSQLEIGNTHYALKKIKESFPSFVSKTYEDLAIEYIQKNYNVLKCGRWWNNNEEIDAIGVGEDYLIVAECKYSNKKVGIDILNILIEKSKKIELKFLIKHYILFSKSGFTDDLQQRANENAQIVLVGNILSC